MLPTVYSTQKLNGLFKWPPFIFTFYLSARTYYAGLKIMSNLIHKWPEWVCRNTI
jgi:hypothetical protein